MRKIMFILLVLSVLLIASCSKIYVCYDGSQQKSADKCPTIPYPTVLERDVEKSVDSFGNAYALSKGDRYSRVNTYVNGENWYAQILFTNIKSEQVNEVTLKIDGKTAIVSCFEGCEYLVFNNNSS